MFRYSLPLLCVVIISTLGCGPSVPVVKTSTVKGQVKLDGKPMATGDILFLVTGQTPQILTVKDGVYSGEATVGKARVEVRSYKDAEPVMMGGQVVNAGSKENFLPAKFNTQTTLSADITAAGPNEFSFDVTSM